MGGHRRSIASWLFLFVGLVLLAASVVALLAFAGRQGWLSAEWRVRVEWFLEAGQRYLPGEEWIRYLAWLAGIAGSAAGAAFTLLASWHFAEMNLPQRLKELKDAHARKHLTLQPALLALARSGLGPVVADIETSRVTFLRKWLSGWSRKEQARVLAASAKRLEKEASALCAAAQASQHEQITAHLIRGYQYVSQGDRDRAFKEFEAATRVRADDIVSRDIAAGWARKTNEQRRERELLKELQQSASAQRVDLHLARALRREAEWLDKLKSKSAWVEARDLLKEAACILEPLIADQRARIELGRVLTLFCEVQCSRTVVLQLGGPMARMRSYIAGVAMHARPEEQGGEEYGEQRALRAEQRVAELRGDVVAQGDTGDQQ